MLRIRVNPEELKLAAREIEAVAGSYRALADRALRAGLNAPSYDGQFGPRVRAIGLEGHARLRALADRLSEQARELERIATDFDNVDRESQRGLTAWGTQLLGLRDSGLRIMTELGIAWEVEGVDLGDEGPPDWARWLPALWFLWWLYCQLKGREALQAYAAFRAEETASVAREPPGGAGSTLVSSDEYFVLTGGIMLRGGIGAPPSYGQKAEESYTGHSYGGDAVPAVMALGLLKDALVWSRD